MQDHPESRRSKAARPAPARSAEPDILRPTLAPEAPPAGAVAIATHAAPPACDDEQADPAAPGPAPDLAAPDLAAYDWYPVLRRPRTDGWTVDVQRRFIEVLADSGSVIEACQAVNRTKSSAYALRRAPGAEGFAGAWRIAIDNAAARALDECFERALVGTDEPVFDRDGRRVGRRLRQSDKLLMFILRAYMPDRFRHAAHDVRAPAEPPAPAVGSLRNAIALVAPAGPARPEETMDADTLAARLWCADVMEGERPRWHTGADEEVAPPSIDARFETALENAKRANAGLPPEGDEDDDRYAR